jgi:hypothetical protein
MPEHTPEAQALIAIVRAARDIRNDAASFDKAREGHPVHGGPVFQYMVTGARMRALLEAFEVADEKWIAAAIASMKAEDARAERPSPVRHEPAPRTPEDSIAWWRDSTLTTTTAQGPKGAVEVPALLAEPVAHAGRLGAPLNFYLCGERWQRDDRRITQGEPPRKCPRCVQQVEPTAKVSRDAIEWYGPSTLANDESVHAVRKDDPGVESTLGGFTLCGLHPGGWYFGVHRRIVNRGSSAPAARHCVGCSQRIDYGSAEGPTP